MRRGQGGGREARTHKLTRSRIFFPLAATVAFLAAYYFVSATPIVIPTIGDIRERIFGAKFNYLLFAATIAAAVVAVRLLDAFFFDILARRRAKVTAPAMLRDIIALGLYAVILGWAFAAIFHRSLPAILTTTTVVAAVIGLALQDTLGNLFSGISLHLEGTFEVGDVIRAGTHIGVVESTTWRSTRLRTPNNNIVVVPNSVLSKESLEVFPHRALAARSVTVGVTYDARPARVIPILEAAARNVEGVSAEVACIARIAGFADSAVTYEIKYWTHSYALRDAIDAEVRKVIWYALRRNAIAIPYPIRSVQNLAETVPDLPLGEGEILGRLREVDLLAPLEDSELAAIESGTDLRLFGRGETIIRAGHEGQSMFVVHRGEVSVRIPERAYEEVARLGAGSVFGEMALLTGESRNADVVAATDVAVLEIGKSAMQPVLLQNPELAAAISRTMVERRDSLALARASGSADEQGTLMARIRTWFGLR